MNFILPDWYFFDVVHIDDIRVDCAVHVGVDFGYNQIGADIDVDVGFEGDTEAQVWSLFSNCSCLWFRSYFVLDEQLFW